MLIWMGIAGQLMDSGVNTFKLSALLFQTGPHLVAPAACQAVPPTCSATAVRIGWLASHGLAQLAGKQSGSAVSKPWRPAKVSLFKLALGHHERRRRSDILGEAGGTSRVVSTGCLAHSPEICLQTDRHPPTRGLLCQIWAGNTWSHRLVERKRSFWPEYCHIPGCLFAIIDWLVVFKLWIRILYHSSQSQLSLYPFHLYHKMMTSWFSMMVFSRLQL